MIQANELRVGNYVLDRGGKVLLIDHWECKDKVSTKLQFVESGDKSFPLHPMTEEVEYLQPIAIDNDWLIKFGFEYSPVLFAYTSEYHYCYFNNENDLVFETF
ncbi:MAG TPA: hypothetical protein PKG93_00915 [Bacilli bacterium]|nr:hypothetical protein [Bacilli bacterium]